LGANADLGYCILRVRTVFSRQMGASDIFKFFRGLIFVWLCRDEGIGSEKRQPGWASEEQSAQDKIYNATAWYAWSEEAEHQ
jgi:hypothetical protein